MQSNFVEDPQHSFVGGQDETPLPSLTTTSSVPEFGMVIDFSPDFAVHLEPLVEAAPMPVAPSVPKHVRSRLGSENYSPRVPVSTDTIDDINANPYYSVAQLTPRARAEAQLRSQAIEHQARGVFTPCVPREPPNGKRPYRPSCLRVSSTKATAHGDLEYSETHEIVSGQDITEAL